MVKRQDQRPILVDSMQKYAELLGTISGGFHWAMLGCVLTRRQRMPIMGYFDSPNEGIN